MTTYLLAWLTVTYACPFGLGHAPDAVKNIVCRRQEVIEDERFKSEDLLRRKVRELAPGRAIAAWRIDESKQARVNIVWLPHVSN